MAETLTPDLCIIGAGAAGIAAATEAARLGAEVVLVERDRLGGSSLYNGAVAGKALAAAGAQAEAARTAPSFGVAAEASRVNFRKLHEHIHEVVTGLVPQQDAARLEALGIRVIAAEGTFTDARTLSAGPDIVVRARRFLLATGSRPVAPELPGLAMVPFFTTETIFANTRKLTHLVIIGADAVGLELAQAFRRLGTEVTVVPGGALLADADPELVAVVLRRLAEEGVRLLEKTSVIAVQARSQGIGIRVSAEAGETTLDASHILVAASRRPDLEPLALEKAGVRLNARGSLVLDASGRTSNRRVHAVGAAADVALPAHAAARAAGDLARHLVTGLPRRPAPPLARVVYTDPELAEVGVSEAAARRRLGDRLRIVRASFAENPRARALRRGHGHCKLLTDADGRIIGAGVVGPYAGELAAFFSLAISTRLPAERLSQLTPPHPTLAEIAVRLGEAAARERPQSLLARRLVPLLRRLP